MSPSGKILSTGFAYEALQWEKEDYRARRATCNLGMALWKIGFMADALDHNGFPSTEFIGESAARDLGLDKTDLAKLTTDAQIEAVSARHQKLHVIAEPLAVTVAAERQAKQAVAS